MSNGQYGVEVGRSAYSACQPVIGRVGRAPGGNTILETGILHADGSWEKVGSHLAEPQPIPAGLGHVVLTPVERDELINELISHRSGSAQAVQVGTELDGATVMAVQHFEYTADPDGAQAVVLMFRKGESRYIVGSVGTDGVLRAETVTDTGDFGQAVNAFAVRSIDRLYTHLNRTAPHLTFGHVADGDELKEGS